MSTKEILKEQENLACQLDPKLLEFIRSRRKGKEYSEIMNQTVKHPSEVLELKSEASRSTKMDTDLPSDSEQVVSLTGDVGTSPSQHNIDTANVNQSGDRVHGSGLETDNTSCQSDVEMSSIAADLAVKSSESNKWLHMDVIEHEKLKWIGDIPPAAPVPPDTPYSARFDFQGRKIAL